MCSDIIIDIFVVSWLVLQVEIMFVDPEQSNMSKHAKVSRAGERKGERERAITSTQKNIQVKFVLFLWKNNRL